MDKKCTKCHKEKPINEFHLKARSKDGHQSFCKECGIKNATEDYKKRKKHILANMSVYNQRKKEQLRKAVECIKERNGCCNCDECDPCCLDCHHVNEKSNNVSSIVLNKNVVKLVEEINKCACVCANCHRKIHAGKLIVSNENLLIIREDEFLEILKQIKESLPDLGRRARK